MFSISSSCCIAAASNFLPYSLGNKFNLICFMEIFVVGLSCAVLGIVFVLFIAEYILAFVGFFFISVCVCAFDIAYVLLSLYNRFVIICDLVLVCSACTMHIAYMTERIDSLTNATYTEYAIPV